jgi:predicted  nucleic acid-binding Zn-ribbon protein
MNHIFATLKTRCDDHRADTELIELSRSVLLGLQSVESRILGSAMATYDLREVSQTLNELTEIFPKRPRHSQCQGANFCYASTSNSANELLFDLIVFTFHVSLLGAMGSEASNPTGTSNLTDCLIKAKKLITENKCSFSGFESLDSRVKFSLTGLPKRGPTSRDDWRTGIAETLMLNSGMAHDNLIRKMEEVCFDLEQRCTTIEAPLRAVEDERDRIAVEAEQLRQQKSELEAQLQQASSTMSQLRQEISHLETHAGSTSTRVEELSASLDAARRELEDQRRNSQETTNSEREKARTRELDLLATITEKEDQIEELQEETRDLKEDNDGLRQTLDTVSKEKGTALEHIIALKQDIIRLGECVEQGKLVLAQKDEEISRLQADQERINSNAEALQKKVRKFLLFLQ